MGPSKAHVVSLSKKLPLLLSTWFHFTIKLKYIEGLMED